MYVYKFRLSTNTAKGRIPNNTYTIWTNVILICIAIGLTVIVVKVKLMNSAKAATFPWPILREITGVVSRSIEAVIICTECAQWFRNEQGWSWKYIEGDPDVFTTVIRRRSWEWGRGRNNGWNWRWNVDLSDYVWSGSNDVIAVISGRSIDGNIGLGQVWKSGSS